ncbi:MAG: HEAT repeat domain-containing protein [Planctomycetaceae bacterium]
MEPTRLCGWSCGGVLLMMAWVLGGPAVGAEPLPSEAELIAVLRSEAAEGDKAITCKKLAVKGSKDAVGDLAKLLSHERLASWARIPLEAIPGPEADEALRTAAGTLSGRLLVGVINSIGVRRDAAATDMLAGKLGDADPEVAAAAAAALGKIGTPEAAALLTKNMADASPRLDDVAQAAIVCAEHLLSAGQTAGAAALYEAVRQGKVKEQRVAEATRGLILTRGKDGIPLLVETLRSPSRRLSNMGLFTSRELLDGPHSGPVDMALAEEASRMAAADGTAKAALIIEAIADRNADGGAGPDLQAKVVSWAKTGPLPVRLAALKAVGRIGDSEAVDPLLVLAEDEAVKDAARVALAALQGDAVDAIVVKRLSNASPSALPILLETVGRRRIPAVPQVKPLVASEDAAVRTAALEAIGQVVDLGILGLLIDAVQKPRSPGEAEVAQKALLSACVRMADREACAATLSKAIGSASADTQVKLLDIAGEVGGAQALSTMAMAAKSGNDALADAATRILGKWMTADAGPVLLDLSGAPIGEKYQTRAIRGYIRIARQFALPDAERAEMCQKALAAAKDAADRKSVLDILPRYPSPATLAVAKQAATLPGLEADAKAAVAAIEAKLKK